MTDCVVTSNEATISGGGGWFSSYLNTATITDTVFSDNLADDKGGGLAWNGVSSGTLTLSGVELSGNLAISGGGAAFFEGGPVTATDLDVHDNIAAEGGGLYIKSQTVTMSSSDVYDNEADESGGVYLESSGVLGLTGSGVYGNLSAGTTGGIALSDSSLTCTGSTTSSTQGVFGNDAAGGVYQISMDALSTVVGSACDLQDPSTLGDGDLYNGGDSSVYSYGLDASFSCDSSGC